MDLLKYVHTGLSECEHIKIIIHETTMTVVNQFKHGIRARVQSLMNRKPAFFISRNGGMSMRYMDFSKKEKYPYDLRQNNQSQVFIEGIANPIRFDIDDFLNEYNEVSPTDTVKQVIEGKHIIPSQRYKTYFQQRVLQDSYNPSFFDQKKILWLLFANLGAVLITLITIIAVVV